MSSAILVTGATGFTGGRLCRRLVDDGEVVVAFVRPTSDTTSLEELGVECRTVDITDPDEVRSGFEPFDRVYHLAAAFRTEHPDRDVFRRVNVDATRHLLDAAEAAGVGRFVHCSTVGVQGEIEDPPATEEYRTKPGDHYQVTKLEGERLARRRFGPGLPGTVVRPVGIYGPGDTRFLKLFRAVDRGHFVMIGSGNTLYHLTYVDDLVRGIRLAGRHPEAPGEVFTLGGPRYTTIEELVDTVADVLDRPRPRLKVPYRPVYWASIACERVCALLGVEPPLYPRRVEFFALDRAFDITKARETLGYEPRMDLEEGLRRTADWYRDEGLL
ncbi:MAG: NAD-dependent epimerase/dehydratase family protein [Gemmatimonadota bacterium]